MTPNPRREPTLVVVELTGGNDALNTLVPYGDPLYYDQRPNQNIPEDQVLDIDGRRGFNMNLAALKPFFDSGKLAVIEGIGYPHPNRSHFRSMDIWHTAEPDDVAEDGWIGKAIRDLDPRGDNPRLGINVGRGMPRAFHLPGVSAASVASVDTYGVLTNLSSVTQRACALDLLARMYSATEGQNDVSLFIGQTGLDAQSGAVILNTAAKAYTSTVEYPKHNPLASSLRDIAKLKLADLGTRFFYTQLGSFDTHANQKESHPRLLKDTAEAIAALCADLDAHAAADDVVVWVFSEFGRRVADNGSGTDHGAGGLAFLIGNRVKGGFYGEAPSLRPTDQIEGDLAFNLDFRSVYTSILEQWMAVEAGPIVGGKFEQLDLFIPYQTRSKNGAKQEARVGQ
jgi:uncharacterized protein (DUF1501 family)